MFIDATRGVKFQSGNGWYCYQCGNKNNNTRCRYSLYIQMLHACRKITNET